MPLGDGSPTSLFAAALPVCASFTTPSLENMLFCHCCPRFSLHQWSFFSLLVSDTLIFVLFRLHLFLLPATLLFLLPLSWQVFAACPSLISSAGLPVYLRVPHPDEAAWDKGRRCGVPWQTAPSMQLPVLEQNPESWSRICPEQITLGPSDINTSFALISCLSATAEPRLKIKPHK